MRQIKFSHKYPKLWNQTKARLIEVNYLTDKDINDDLRKYDTFWSDNDKNGYYEKSF